MNKQIINKFYGNIKNVLTMEKLKENLKLPVYAYIISFVLGIIAVIVIVLLLKPDMSGGVIKPEKFGQITNRTLITEGTWSDIIKHNISILIFLFISGIVVYIGPILILGVNGFFHGLLLGLSILGFGGMGLVKYLVLMGPHGIFELPALFFSAGAGILLSKEIWHIATSYYFFHTSRLVDKNRLYEAFHLLLIALGLFLIASVFETQVTFRILKVFMQ